MESGASGTSYAQGPVDGQLTKILVVDNDGSQPLNYKAQSMDEDSARTYVVGADGSSTYQFDRVEVSNSGHLAFISGDGTDTTVEIGNLVGDLSGYLHIMRGVSVNVMDSASPFPTAFAIYEGGTFSGPSGKPYCHCNILCICKTSVN